jgi:hypothetical protein
VAATLAPQPFHASLNPVEGIGPAEAQRLARYLALPNDGLRQVHPSTRH